TSPPPTGLASFGIGTWNVFGFNSTTVGTNYAGLYTENGSGSTGLDFDTRTRWGTGGSPSDANATNGTAWQGCVVGGENFSLSARRTGFTCGVYRIDVPAYDDDSRLLINGVEVASTVFGNNFNNTWTGVLNANSTVEFQLVETSGQAFLQIAFTLITQPVGTTVWAGGTSNNWFTASNWCGGVPTASLDALIPAAGPQNMPLINGAGAVARDVTINPSIPATGAPLVRPLIPAASLTSNTFNLDVNRNWVNNGTFTANLGTVSFVGAGSGHTITTNGTNAFNNVVINKTNGITFSTGISEVNGTMTFTNGLVSQTGTFRFLNGSSAAGANNSSYIIGAVTKIGTNAFTFPIGSGTFYRP
ncbi:MAG: hypothetical protein EAY75_05520, partial [Bacteroidetes bacterium]